MLYLLVGWGMGMGICDGSGRKGWVESIGVYTRRGGIHHREGKVDGWTCVGKGKIKSNRPLSRLLHSPSFLISQSPLTKNHKVAS